MFWTKILETKSTCLGRKDSINPLTRWHIYLYRASEQLAQPGSCARAAPVRMYRTRCGPLSRKPYLGRLRLHRGLMRRANVLIIPICSRCVLCICRNANRMLMPYNMPAYWRKRFVTESPSACDCNVWFCATTTSFYFARPKRTRQTNRKAIAPRAPSNKSLVNAIFARVRLVFGTEFIGNMGGLIN